MENPFEIPLLPDEGEAKFTENKLLQQLCEFETTVAELRPKSDEKPNLMYGCCPDRQCNEFIVFDVNNKTKKVVCPFCAQRHRLGKLRYFSPTNFRESLLMVYRYTTMPKRAGPEWSRIDGVSPFLCKMISKFFTKYAVDATTGEAKLLTELGQNQLFETKLLRDRAFMINSDDLETPGYGIDMTGGAQYLATTLKIIKSYNNNLTVLEPLHVAGDGSCLVHALSRALCGREIYWHALRENMFRHLQRAEEWYRKTLKDFLAEDDFTEIINECRPDYIPKDNQSGLRNFHIFALANVLYRPIILLDSSEKMAMGSEFAAVFLPLYRNPEECKNEDRRLNSPLVIAWSSAAHNHFVPLVAVEDRRIPRLTKGFLPKVWFADEQQLLRYIHFDSKMHCFVACGKQFDSDDLRKMISAMERQYLKIYKIDPRLVCDYCENIRADESFSSSSINDRARHCFKDATACHLWRCMICWRLSYLHPIPSKMLEKGMFLFNHFAESCGKLSPNIAYSYPPFGKFIYDAELDSLSPIFLLSKKCDHCDYQGPNMRLQLVDGKILHQNFDHTRTPCEVNAATETTGGQMPSVCCRQTKHWIEGKEYDFMPLKISFKVNWNGITKNGSLYWFEKEKNVHLNTDPYAEAKKFVSANFPSIRILNTHSCENLWISYRRCTYCSGEVSNQELINVIIDKIMLQASVYNIAVEKLCQNPFWTFLTDVFRFPMETSEPAHIRENEEFPEPADALAEMKEHFRKTFQQYATSSFSALLPKTVEEKEILMKTTAKSVPLHFPPFIKIICFDGRSTKIVINKLPTYGDLVKDICLKFDIGQEESSKIILLDHIQLLFDDDQYPLQLKSGSKITMLISRTKNKPVESFAEKRVLEQSMREIVMILLLNLFDSLNNSTEEFWFYVIQRSELFKTDGTIYRLAKFDINLVDGYHFAMPTFFGDKVLIYNGIDDEIECCAGYLGHFKFTEHFKYDVSAALIAFHAANEKQPPKLVEVRVNNPAIGKAYLVKSCQMFQKEGEVD